MKNQTGIRVMRFINKIFNLKCKCRFPNLRHYYSSEGKVEFCVACQRRRF